MPFSTRRAVVAVACCLFGPISLTLAGEGQGAIAPDPATIHPPTLTIDARPNDDLSAELASAGLDIDGLVIAPDAPDRRPLARHNRPTPVPEPGMLVLMALGFGGLALRPRRR